MFQKKKIIWWETEPVIGGAEQARARGSHDEVGRRRTAAAPYYGPVTLRDDDPDELIILSAS